MRALLFLFIALLPSILAVQDVGQNGFTNPACLLSDLSLAGLTLHNVANPGVGFSSTDKEYSCTCPPSISSTQAEVALYDDASHADVKWNGNDVNSAALGNPLSNTHTLSNDIPLQTGNNVITVTVECAKDPNQNNQSPCSYTYTITCSKAPDQGGSVIGDPQFTGLRGQSYQVHGVAGEVYNIVSDPSFQINSRFVFLDHGACPIIDGIRQKGCWSHPGSYLGGIGVKTKNGDRLLLESGAADQGFAKVEWNKRALSVGDSFEFDNPSGFISFNSSHMVTIAVGGWEFVYENSDRFINQAVSYSGDISGLKSHGLLGQTHKATTYKSSIKYIQGQVDDYVIREKDIFGDTFIYNMFN